MQNLLQKYTLEFFNLSNSYLLKKQEQGSSFEKIKINGIDHLVFFDNVFVNEITTGKSKFFIKGIRGFPLKYIMGNGLLTSNGEIHLRDRRIIQPVFNKKNIEKYLNVFLSKTKKQILLWNNNEEINLSSGFSELLLSIVSESLFSSDFSTIEDFDETKNLFVHKEKIKKLSDIWQNIIDKRKNNNIKNGDLLDILLNNDTYVFSEKELKDHLATIIVSDKTTTSLLSWSIFFISKNKNVLKDLQNEADSCLWIQENRAPTLEEIHNSFEISKKIIKETLRLYPPVWFLMRQATEDVEIASTIIPKGSNVLISQYIIHRNKKIFFEPEKWNPYRWTKDFEKGLPKGSYIPFGQGARQCIGNEFAIVETQMILLLMAKYFSWESLPKNQEIDVNANITLMPGKNIKVLLKKRD